MQSNEELAIKIKQGSNNLLPQLWEQVQRLIYLWANRYFTLYGDSLSRAGVTVEDLVQEGYFALVDAIQVYNTESGYKFTTYLKYPLKNRFNGVLGFRNVKGSKDTLLHSTSLDKPLGGNTEGISIGDSIPDYEAEKKMESVIEKEYLKKLHDDLEKSLEMIEPLQKEVIREKYYNGKTISDIGRQMGVGYSRIRTLEYKALLNMRRKPEQRRLLSPYKLDMIDTHAYRSGFSRWKNTGTSSTENTALFLLDKE